MQPEAHKTSFLLFGENAVASLGEEAAQVFDAHMMVLADPEMTGQIKETIVRKINAEAGLKEVTDMFIAILKEWKTILTCKNIKRSRYS